MRQGLNEPSKRTPTALIKYVNKNQEKSPVRASCGVLEANEQHLYRGVTRDIPADSWLTDSVKRRKSLLLQEFIFLLQLNLRQTECHFLLRAIPLLESRWLACWKFITSFVLLIMQSLHKKLLTLLAISSDPSSILSACGDLRVPLFSVLKMVLEKQAENNFLRNVNEICNTCARDAGTSGTMFAPRAASNHYTLKAEIPVVAGENARRAEKMVAQWWNRFFSVVYKGLNQKVIWCKTMPTTSSWWWKQVVIELDGR